ncbi:MAG: hypothetical protein PVF82_20825 [Gammaproteobacteria bacterium]|jgi:hypothetical protein
MAMRTSPATALCILLALAAGAISLPADAQEKPKKISFLVGFESKTGGANVGELVVTSRAANDKGDVETGSGMHFYLGMIYRPVSAFETRLTAGYHMDRSPTDTGTVYMDRYPIELIPTFCYHNHRLGLGLSYQKNIVLYGDDFGSPNVTFKDALGYTAEYGYKVAPFMYVGFRYMSIFYDIENPGVTLHGERKVNASNFGINLYFQF